MAGIFTRNALNKIMEDENLTPQQRTEQVYSLYGRALDDGYISKSAAQQAQQDALESAKAAWAKEQTPPDPKASDEYKALEGEFSAYKAMQAARTSADFKEVKPKFFETVYGLVDRAEGAKPLTEQLAGIRAAYEEYFLAPQGKPGRTPAVVLPSGTTPAPGRGPSLSEMMKAKNENPSMEIFFR
ncbi:MAG: hypothetical protein Q4C10_06345 [Clostridia bacterium]|nr:hypothetical protein [Clostridia bacterium]